MAKFQTEDRLAQLQAEIKGFVGKELLQEMLLAKWEVTSPVNIDEGNISISCSNGSQRRRNEDRFAVAHITRADGEDFSIAMVCDGVGGSEMGDLAASIAIAAAISELCESSGKTGLALMIAGLIRRADEAVRLTLLGRGTTTVVMVLARADGEIVGASVGDSRLYSWEPTSRIFDQISVDDTLENVFKEMSVKDRSYLDVHGIAGRLSQAIGEHGRTAGELRITIYDRAHLVSGAVLATDGAWKSSEEGFIKICKNADTAASLVRKTSAFALWTGGIDNVTVLAIEDLVKFSTPNETEAKKNSGEVRASIWVANAKIVLVKFSPTKYSYASETGLRSQADHVPAKKKSKARKSKISPSKRHEPQLALKQVDEGWGTPSEKKALIEVTTDPEPSKD